MGKLIDLTGQRFGSWTVIQREGSYQCRPSYSNPHGHTIPVWLCRCDCGTFGFVIGPNLRSGRSSCCKKCRDKKRTAGLRHYHKKVLELKSMFPEVFMR